METEKKARREMTRWQKAREAMKRWQRREAQKLLEELADERWQQLSPREQMDRKAPLLVSPEDQPVFGRKRRKK